MTLTTALPLVGMALATGGAAVADTTDKPFPAALDDLLRERGYTTKLGHVNYSDFARHMEGFHYETLRKVLVGERGLYPPLIEAVAKALEVDPSYFAEYRLWQARRMFDVNEVGRDEAMRNLRDWLKRRR